MKLNTITKFVLLAHDPVKGKFLIPDFYINYGIIGSLLIEMNLEHLIKLDNHLVIPISHHAIKNEIFFEILTKIGSSKKPRRIKYWIKKLSPNSKKYKEEILTILNQEHIIRIEHKRFIGIFSYKKSYIVNNDLREEIIYHLKDAVLSSNKISNEDLLILSLIRACNMHHILSDNKEELKHICKALDQVMKLSPISADLEKIIVEIQTALIATIAISSNTSYT
ncbi:MAG: GPP34 family phosphoprotein [Bacteroidales bacterium]